VNNYNTKFETILERYGILSTVVKERFPRKLNLSNEFVAAFREEFKNQTASTITEDEDGNQIETPGRSKNTVLREMQKALKFLSKGV
tara:strand:- start:803 stop:1063 length:261 start_codon:yes stop_codon:yes gene_type:complete